MNDRDRVLFFLSARYDAAGLTRLAGEIGLHWAASPVGPLHAQADALLLFVERDGLDAALRACLERDHPGALTASEPIEAAPAADDIAASAPPDPAAFP